MVKKETKNESTNESTEEKSQVESSDLNSDHKEDILAYLKRNEKVTSEILKSLKFIRRYYFFRSLFNSLKIALVILVIILGIVTWDNLTGAVSGFSNDIEKAFTETIQESVGERINSN